MSNPHSHNHSHSHSHNHSHSHVDPSSSLSGLISAFVLNAGFCIIEAFGGYYSSSQAIMADALHDFGDSLSLLILIALKWLSVKPSTEKFSYGYRRLNIIGAAIVGVSLVVGSFVILANSFPKLMSPQPVNSPMMMGLAVLGILVNGLAVYRLKAHSHHDEKNIGEKLVSLHLLEDLWGWVIVLIGAIAIYSFSWYWIDPLLSIFLAFFILWRTYINLAEIGRILLLGANKDFSLERITGILKSVEGVMSCHHIHIWELDFGYHVVTGHIVLKSEASDVKVKEQIRKKIAEVGPSEVTLEIEREGEDCSDPEHSN